MEKQKTFESQASAAEWLLEIARAFTIKRAVIQHFKIHKGSYVWDSLNRWRVIVRFD